MINKESIGGDGHFILPVGYIIAICLPFMTHFLFRPKNDHPRENNKTVYANMKNLTKSNNKYYVGNYYTLQLNITELFEDIFMTIDTYEFLKENFSTDSTTIELEFGNEDMDKAWMKINKLFELIIRDLRIDCLYVLVSENSIDFKELVDKSKQIKLVNMLDLYGYLNPKVRKICFRKSLDEPDYTGGGANPNTLFDCEDHEIDDVIECSSCDDEDDDDDPDEEPISKLEETIATFRCMKRNYKNIYNIMNCI